MDRLVQLGGKHASELEMEIGRLVEDWNPRAAKVHAQVDVADAHEEAARAAPLSAETETPGSVPLFLGPAVPIGALLIARTSDATPLFFRALFFISRASFCSRRSSCCSQGFDRWFL